MTRIPQILVLLLVVSVFATAFAASAEAPDGQNAPAAGPSGKSVLIYGPSMGAALAPPWDYSEATVATDLGHTVIFADARAWMSLTAVEFAGFDAIIFGDPKCEVASVGPVLLEPANVNKAVWSPAIIGPTIVLGPTPQLYQFNPNLEDRQLIANGIDFAASGPGTGLYVSLSCYYAQAPSNSAVEFLSEVGDFRVGGRDSCSGSETIVDPAHPAMAGLTSLGQPELGCASQEFLSAFPDSLTPLATGVRMSNEAVVLPFIVATPYVAFPDPPADPPGDPHSHTPFDAFWAEFEQEDDEFEVEGTFTLGTTSNGIDPLTEDVTVTIGAYEIVIPAGSFSLDDDGEFEFEGTIDGMEVEMEIELEDDGTFEFEIEVEGDNLPELEEAPEVTLIIGDDKGTAEASEEHEDDRDECRKRGKGHDKGKGKGHGTGHQDCDEDEDD